jgi:hypothetical protein
MRRTADIVVCFTALVVVSMKVTELLPIETTAIVLWSGA